MGRPHPARSWGVSFRSKRRNTRKEQMFPLQHRFAMFALWRRQCSGLANVWMINEQRDVSEINLTGEYHVQDKGARP